MWYFHSLQLLTDWIATKYMCISKAWLAQKQTPWWAPHSCRMCSVSLCGNGLGEEAHVQGPTLLAPAGLILIPDARPIVQRQHGRSDLCGIRSQGFYQGSTGLDGVNRFTAVRAHSTDLCLSLCFIIHCIWLERSTGRRYSNQLCFDESKKNKMRT